METNKAGMATTVSNAAEATGGLAAGNFIQPDIDEQLVRFNSDDTPLMNLMLRAKRVKVNSPEVDHYMIDEPRAVVTTTAAIQGSNKLQAELPLSSTDQNLPRPFTTLLVEDVDGYDENGNLTPGRPLMLFVKARSSASNLPVVMAVNGIRESAADEVSLIPNIPAGSRVVILANSLYETQKEVDPDLTVPRPTRVYLQKRGMNQVVSDYFDAQRKSIPFSKAIIAEQAIANFKVRGNRTLWAGRAGKFKMDVDKMGMQYVYTTEGVRWQFKRELQHAGRWTVEKIIALAKMFFTGEDVPKTALLLAGKNLLEEIQCIDFSKHPEIQISATTNKMGWAVTQFHTVFGDIQIKREPTLDRLGWSNSGALLGEDRIVHYVYSQEHHFSDRIDGEEATRSGILTWDAIALKGSCHIWIDGEGGKSAPNGVGIQIWDSAEAPADTSGNVVYYLLADCPGMAASARSGQMWHYSTASSAWEEYGEELRSV